jgi:hypothetical protein
MDTTTSLFEHVKNRLPTGFGFGDDDKIIDSNLVPNHQTSQQSIREDHEGDVGIFEMNSSTYDFSKFMHGMITEVQVAVVTKQGNIEEARKYLLSLLKNLQSDIKSSSIYIYNCDLVNLIPLGKNSVGFQMVSMVLSIKYINI